MEQVFIVNWQKNAGHHKNNKGQSIKNVIQDF